MLKRPFLRPPALWKEGALSESLGKHATTAAACTQCTQFMEVSTKQGPPQQSAAATWPEAWLAAVVPKPRCRSLMPLEPSCSPHARLASRLRGHGCGRAAAARGTQGVSCFALLARRAWPHQGLCWAAGSPAKGEGLRAPSSAGRLAAKLVAAAGFAGAQLSRPERARQAEGLEGPEPVQPAPALLLSPGHLVIPHKVTWK